MTEVAGQVGCQGVDEIYLVFTWPPFKRSTFFPLVLSGVNQQICRSKMIVVVVVSSSSSSSSGSSNSGSSSSSSRSRSSSSR